MQMNYRIVIVTVLVGDSIDWHGVNMKVWVFNVHIAKKDDNLVMPPPAKFFLLNFIGD